MGISVSIPGHTVSTTRDPKVTEEVKNLLGDDLLHVTAPSEIFFSREILSISASVDRFGRKVGNKNAIENRLGETTS